MLGAQGVGDTDSGEARAQRVNLKKIWFLRIEQALSYPYSAIYTQSTPRCAIKITERYKLNASVVTVILVIEPGMLVRYNRESIITIKTE